MTPNGISTHHNEGDLMQKVFCIALILSLVGCTTISSLPSEDAPMPVKAAAIVADAAVTWRLWELWGWVK
jgi:hypothetical protein